MNGPMWTPTEERAAQTAMARFMRELDDMAIAGMRIGTAHYVENGRHHRALFDDAPQN